MTPKGRLGLPLVESLRLYVEQGLGGYGSLATPGWAGALCTGVALTILRVGMLLKYISSI